MTVKLRERLNNTDVFDIGTEVIPRGHCVVLHNGAIFPSKSNAPKFIGITVEAGYVRKEARVALGGSTALAVAGNDNIAEGDWLVSDDSGRVICAPAASQGTVCYFVGYALRGGAYEGQLIPVVVWPVRVDNPSP